LLDNFPAKVGRFLVWIKLGKTGITSRRHGSGRPYSVRTDDNIDSVNELISSQEGRPTPKSHRTTRQIHERQEFSTLRYTV